MDVSFLKKERFVITANLSFFILLNLFTGGNSFTNTWDKVRIYSIKSKKTY